MVKLENRKWELSHFEQEREAVLKSWPTGAEVDLADAFEFHRSLPESKIAYYKLKAALMTERSTCNPERVWHCSLSISIFCPGWKLKVKLTFYQQL